MSRQFLEKYTQDNSYHGVNSLEVLENFMNYQATCKDPLLVFRFMEQKAICTFLPAFWLKKAEIYSQLGDYNSCFECVQFAWSRTQEQELNILKEIELAQDKFRKQMINDMKQHPLKSKRTVFQFDMNSESFNCTKDNQGTILKIYQEKYKTLRKEKQIIFQSKRCMLPQSWLFQFYKKEDEKEKIIQEKIHENSIKISKEVKYHSMHTPIRVRDPQRLTKTMDSVEILKKKKSTREKSKTNHKLLAEQIQSEPDIDMNDQSNTRMMVSLPVGRKFASAKRRVTFQNEILKRESQQVKLEKNPVQSKEERSKEPQKMEEEENYACQIKREDIEKGK